MPPQKNKIPGYAVGSGGNGMRSQVGQNCVKDTKEEESAILESIVHKMAAIFKVIRVNFETM